MSEKYLTDEELEDVAERTCLRDMERAIADAASDKTAKVIVDYLYSFQSSASAFAVDELCEWLGKPEWTEAKHE